MKHAARGMDERILEGALHALARRTPSGISMTDVADSAGVSRGTLYRYFPDKASLLRALTEYERERYENSLRAQLHDVAPGPQRVLLLIDHTLTYFAAHPSLGYLLDVEPEFVLENLRARLPSMQAATEELLAPAMDDLAMVRDGRVTTAQFSALLLRLLLSTFLLPDHEPEALTSALRELMQEVASPSDAAPR